MGIGSAELKPGQVNQITGANNQGKTTILKAFEFAVKGSSDASLVKIGEDAAEVIVELADETVIRRRLSAQGKQAVSVSKGEFAAKSPQEILNGLFSSSSFNPITLLDPKMRHDAIMSSIDLKLSRERIAEMLGMLPEYFEGFNFDQHGLKVLDEVYRFLYAKRAEANREAKEKADRFKIFADDLEKMEVVNPLMTVEQIYSEQNRLMDARVATEKELSTVSQLERQKKAHQNEVSRWNLKAYQINEEIKDLEGKIASLKMSLSVAREEEKKAQDVVNSLVVPDSSTLNQIIAEIETSFKETEVQMGLVRQQQNRSRFEEKVQSLKSELETSKHEAQKWDDRVKKISNEIKTDIMNSVEMPISGLHYSGGEFYVDDVRVDNLSSSRAMVMAVKIARKLAKKTKVICVDGAEMLDPDTFEALHKEIENDGYTYFISSVGDGFDHPSDKKFAMKSGVVSEVQHGAH